MLYNRKSTRVFCDCMNRQTIWNMITNKSGKSHYCIINNNKQEYRAEEFYIK